MQIAFLVYLVKNFNLMLVAHDDRPLGIKAMSCRFVKIGLCLAFNILRCVCVVFVKLKI
jgi:hypothetical protein